MTIWLNLTNSPFSYFRIIPTIDRPAGAVRLQRSMNELATKTVDQRLTEGLARSGFRFTPQREHVYAVLLDKRDHPTAEEVFIRAKRTMPEISMATVYNCLDALVRCGLAKQLTLERGAARFCPNMSAHGHFYCDNCENVYDIELPPETVTPLPEGFQAERREIVIHGRCADCAGIEPGIATSGAKTSLGH
jgi:Fur family transcriptional regulator, peroxide stress response regulator